VVHYAPFNFLASPAAMAIIKLVALKHGVGVSDIRGPRRSRPVAIARHEAVWLVHTHCQHLSTTQVGRLFGGRDHSTALNSIRLFAAKRGQGKC
jgi:chromosomal replication initiator protein